MEEQQGNNHAGNHPYPNANKDDPPYDPANFAEDPLKDEITAGVLLGDAIARYAGVLKPKLVDPFDPKRVRSASYALTLGEEYYRNGDYGRLSKEQPDLVVQPYGIIVVETAEVIHMPRYMIGRWNLRLSYVYSGLLWSGAAQVDPGYQGKLCCPLYNLSDKPVSLKFGEHIFTIDFEKTTKYSDKAEDYRFNKGEEQPGENLTTPKVTMLRDLAHLPTYGDFKLISGVENLKKGLDMNSAQISSATQDITQDREDLQEKINKSVGDLQKRFTDFAAIMFTVLSIIFASLTIVGFAPVLAKQTVPPSNLLTVLFTSASVVALLLSAIALSLILRLREKAHK